MWVEDRQIEELEEKQLIPVEELLKLELEIEGASSKLVDSDWLRHNLGVLEQLWENATPEERQEMLQLQIQSVTWYGDRIALAVYDMPLDGSAPSLFPRDDVPSDAERKISSFGGHSHDGAATVTDDFSVNMKRGPHGVQKLTLLADSTTIPTESLRAHSATVVKEKSTMISGDPPFRTIEPLK